MLSEKVTVAQQGLADQIQDLQARLAAQEIKIASLEQSLELALNTVERFADVKPPLRRRSMI